MGLGDQIVLRARELVSIWLASGQLTRKASAIAMRPGWPRLPRQDAYLARPDAVARRKDLSLSLAGVVRWWWWAQPLLHSPNTDLRADPSRGHRQLRSGDDYHDVLMSAPAAGAC